MQQYKQYKDSGVAWLGEVPSHWEVLSIKRLSQVKRGASPRPIDNPDYFDDNGEYAWVRIADVTASNTYLFETTQKLSDLGKMFSVPLEPDSLFLSIAGSVGKPIITKIKACIHDGFVYFPEYKNNIKFLYYIFLSGQPYLGLGKMGTQLNLNTDTVGSIKIGLPPLPEQTAIATYLDSKLGEIDRLISKQETLLEKLAEQRTAIITHTVTKGLNPDVEMKNSGMAWLGEVPEHWEIINLKYLCCVKGGYAFPSDNFSDTGIPVIRISDILFDGSVDSENCKKIPREIDPKNKDYQLEKGQLVMAMTGATIGKVSVYQDEKLAYINQRVGKFELIGSKLDYAFLGYILKTSSYHEHIKLTAFGGAQANISDIEMVGYIIALPPLAEQTTIATHLDEQTAQIDRLSERVQQVIESLKSYRSALITQAVTGKIKVI